MVFMAHKDDLVEEAVGDREKNSVKINPTNLQDNLAIMPKRIVEFSKELSKDFESKVQGGYQNPAGFAGKTAVA